MIAKRVPRKGGHSNFRHLAEYILDKKHDGHKVAAAWTSNTSVPEDFDLAIIETQATQELNIRSKIDKTYHLVISLAIDEQLGIEQFKEIESKCCEAIGLGEHHRICAIHNDTHALHLHIALSKVHPVTLNTIEPYYDKFKLQEICRECEKIFNLQPGICPEEQEKRNILEIQQGIVSFQSWIKVNLREELLALIKRPECCWQDVQALAGKYGIEIREHKTGLVFSNLSEKLFVKASAVDRSFGKKAMVEKLGKFQPASPTVSPVTTYRRGLLAGDARNKDLYAKYQEQMAKIRGERKERMAVQRDRRLNAITEVKFRYAKRRQQVRLDPIISNAKKFEIRKSLTIQMNHEIDRCLQETRREQRVFREKSVTKSWRDWLRDQAKDGNIIALGILRQKQTVVNIQFGNSNNLPENNGFAPTGGQPKMQQTASKITLQRDKGIER